MIAGSPPRIISQKIIPIKGISAKCVASGNSLIADITIPRSFLSVDAFRLNIGFADLDDLISTDPSVMWWKPKWGSRNDYSGSGLFIIQNE
jgi:hypothetical protein